MLLPAIFHVPIFKAILFLVFLCHIFLFSERLSLFLGRRERMSQTQKLFLGQNDLDGIELFDGHQEVELTPVLMGCHPDRHIFVADSCHIIKLHTFK